MKPFLMEKALVLFSGGQDSATCLAWALNNFSHVETIGFSYGQRHSVELKAREKLRNYFISNYSNLHEDHIFTTDILSELGGSSLLDDSTIKNNEDGLPSSFVPGRNLFFLTCAGALAYREKIKNIIIGVCETDFSGYPDCRQSSIISSQKALNACMNSDFIIHTPLMRLTKAQTWELAAKMGGEELVEAIREHSHTCYTGDHETRHSWGYGCGACPACLLREKGWKEYLKNK